MNEHEQEQKQEQVVENQLSTEVATEVAEEKQSSSPFQLNQEEVKENLNAIQKNIEAFSSKVGEGLRESLDKAEFTPDHILGYVKTFFSMQPSAVLELPKFDFVTLGGVLLAQVLFFSTAFYAVFSSIIRTLTFGFVTTAGFGYYVQLFAFSFLSAGLVYLSIIYLNQRLLKKVDWLSGLDRLAKLTLPLTMSSVLATVLGFFSPSFALFLLSLGFISSGILYLFEVLRLTAQDEKQRDSFLILYEIIFLLGLTHSMFFYLIVR